MESDNSGFPAVCPSELPTESFGFCSAWWPMYNWLLWYDSANSTLKTIYYYIMKGPNFDQPPKDILWSWFDTNQPSTTGP